MDDLADLRKLENAGEVMMAPPGVVSQEERQQAEQVFLAFETASVSCATCQQIIGKSIESLSCIHRPFHGQKPTVGCTFTFMLFLP
eukprot:m.78751 g.78751  ORF g.78751 m.78751 type:complete len:86 (+) comp36115_c0_seq5:87-344(+)